MRTFHLTCYQCFKSKSLDSFVHDSFVKRAIQPAILLMGFRQPYLSSLLAHFETLKISCHARKPEPLIKYFIVIFSHVYL